MAETLELYPRRRGGEMEEMTIHMEKSLIVWQVGVCMNRAQKGEGFPGQRIVVLPRAIVEKSQAHPLLGGLLPTDAGFFPKARGHYRERCQGVDQAIFIYCTRGMGWAELGGRRVTVRPGELLV